MRVMGQDAAAPTDTCPCISPCIYGHCTDLAAILTGVPVAGARIQPATVYEARDNLLASFVHLGMISIPYASRASAAARAHRRPLTRASGYSAHDVCMTKSPAKAQHCTPFSSGWAQRDADCKRRMQPPPVANLTTAAKSRAAAAQAGSSSSPSRLDYVVRRLHLHTSPPHAAAVHRQPLLPGAASHELEQQLLSVLERTLAGDEAAIWGALHALSQQFPEPGCKGQLAETGPSGRGTGRPTTHGLCSAGVPECGPSWRQLQLQCSRQDLTR